MKMNKLLAALLSEEAKATIGGLLSRYTGPLSVEQVREGVLQCLANATGLYADAQLLLENARFARSLALAVTCIEEVGKIQVLRAMNRLTKKNQKARVEKWKQFRHHEPKSTWGLVGTYPDESRCDMGMLMLLAGMQQELAPLAERLRQAGLYVDYHGDEKRWVSPEEVTATDAGDMLERARSCLDRTKAIEDFGLMSVGALETERDVYAKLHESMPISGTEEDFARFQSATMACHKEFFRRLVENGLLSPQDDLTVMGVPVSVFTASETEPEDAQSGE